MMITVAFWCVCMLGTGILSFLLLHRKWPNMKWDEVLLWSSTAVILNLTFLSTLLAVAGIYSLLHMSLFLLGQCALLFFIALRSKAFGYVTRWQNHKKWNWADWSALAIIIVCAFLYLGYPTWYMLGGRDPGLYYLGGVHISDTGSVQYATDLLLQNNYEELGAIIYQDYPGLYSAIRYGVSSSVGDFIPQFMPMLSSALAVAYDIGGLQALVRANGIYALMSMITMYYYCKRFFNQGTGVLVLLFLAINPAQLWAARITQTEILSQWLLFVACALFAYAWQKNRGKLALLSGLLLGIGIMNRVDILIVGAGVYLLLAYSALWAREQRKLTILCTIGYTVSGGLSLLYGWKYSYPYFHDLWARGTLSKITYLNAALLVGAVFVLLVGFFIHKQGRTLKSPLRKVFGTPMLWGGACAALLLIGLCAYFVRPFVGSGIIGTTEYFNEHALVEFEWYVPGFALLMAVWGLFCYFRGDQKSKDAMLLFFLIAFSSLAVYIWRPSITPDHIWASRRWITISIPFVLILAGYGMFEMGEKLYRRDSWSAMITVALCVVLVMMPLLKRSHTFLFQSMYDGVDQQYEQLAEQLDDDIVYITDNAQYASMLKYIYGKKVYRMHAWSDALADGIKAYIQNHGEFYYIGSASSAAKAEAYGIETALISEQSISGLFLERISGSFPDTLNLDQYAASIYRLSYVEP